MMVHERKIAAKLTPRHRFAPRRGWTLIELLIVMTLAAGLSGLAIVMLAGVLRANSQGVAQIADQAVTFRLAEQFRTDVAAASQCRPIDATRPQSGIVLHTDDRSRIEYVPAVHSLERIAYTGLEINRRESYQLGNTRLIRLQIGQESPTIVSCVLETSANESDESSVENPQVENPKADNRTLDITAILGSDARFGRTAPSSSDEHPAESSATPKADEPTGSGDS